MDAENSFEPVVSRISLRTLNGWWQGIRLRKGTRRGFEKGMGVIFKEGLLAESVRVGRKSSEVQLLTHPNFRIAARFVGDDRPVTFQGNGILPGGKAQGLVMDVPQDLFASREKPLTLTTSSLGANFPEGIPIGKVFGLEGGEDGLFKIGQVALNEELGSILEVTVLTPASEFQSQVRKPNLSTLVILASSVLVIHLVGIVNSSLGTLGVLCLSSGSFLLVPTIHLGRLRATLAIVVIGFSLDVQNNTFFGFHTIALMIFHLIGTEWVQIGQQGELIRPFLLQIMANLVIAMTCLSSLNFLKEASSAWSPYRFCSDSVISILIFIPLCRWFPFFCEELLQLLGALGEQEQRPI